MLQVRQVQKRYGKLLAVNDVSFEVAKGQRFGLLGPNGAGKTTTMSMITGTLDADSGAIELAGKPVGVRHLESKRLIGYVPQEIALFDELSANANLQFFCALFGLLGEAAKRASERALDIAGLRDRATEPVKNYSGGMKRRLNIAAALLHDPELLIFDEPTVGVDPQSRNAIFETLLRLSAEGKTMIYTTHYMEEVERLCDRVAVMDHGQIIANGSLSDLNRLLPKSDRVEIEFEGGTVPSLDRLRDLVVTDGKLTFQAQHLSQDVTGVLTTLQAGGVRVTGIRTETASLEDVFLHLTGRTLRD